MAKGWNNTVPLGRAGTGNATIYGDNPVAAQFGNQLAGLRQREYQDELLAQKEAERLAGIYRDNALAASEGRLWADQIGGVEQGHIQKGIELQQKGINPYGSSPEALQYQKERRLVQSKQGYRKTTESRLNELNKLIGANPDKYEPEDVKSVNDFFSNTKLEDAYAGNLALPQLRERFNVNDALKGVKAVTREDVDVNGNIKSDKRFIDTEATENAVLGNIARDPRGQAFINKITSGIPVNELRTFSPKLDENKKRVESEVKGNPMLLVDLAKQGILPDTPQMTEFVDKLAQTQTQAKRKYDNEIQPLIASTAQGITLYDKQTNDFTEANYRENVRRNNLADRRENRLASEGSDSETVEVTDKVQLPFGQGGKEVVEGKDVVKLSIPQKNFVGSTAVDLKTGQSTKLKRSSNDYEVVSVGNYPVLNRDIVVKNNDGSTRTLKKGSLAQPNYASKFPENVTDKPYIHVQEKVGDSKVDKLVDYSYMPKGLTKAQNEALKGFKPATQTKATPATKTTVKTANKSQIKSLVGTKGYEGYTEQELIDYYKSQGYTIK